MSKKEIEKKLEEAKKLNYLEEYHVVLNIPVPDDVLASLEEL